MIIADVIANQAAKMLLIQRDDVVEDVSATTPNPSLRNSVLPRRLHASSLGLQTGLLQELEYLSIEFRVAVENDVAIRGGAGKRLAQLLQDPLRSRLSSNVEVQNPPAPVLDNEEAVEQLKSHARHGEKVDSHDHLAVILKEGQPPFFRVATALNPPKIAGYGPFATTKPSF